VADRVVSAADRLPDKPETCPARPRGLFYPSLLAAVSDATHPSGRSAALGVYRFWRDAGYALGALIGGITAVLASLDTAILVATILTAASGLLAWAVMDETQPAPYARHGPPS
jgi:MFS family permease